MSDGGLVQVTEAARVPLREAKACFSELVARADLLDEITVLTKHGRPVAAIVPSYVGDAREPLVELWALLDRVSPPGADAAVDDARTRRRGRGDGPAR